MTKIHADNMQITQGAPAFSILYSQWHYPYVCSRSHYINYANCLEYSRGMQRERKQSSAKQKKYKNYCLLAVTVEFC